MLRASLAMFIAVVMLCAVADATFAQVEVTTWGQLKNGIAVEKTPLGLASFAEAATASSGMLMSELFLLARETGFRIPAIAGDPDCPTADESQVLARWRDSFYLYLDTECDLGTVVGCIHNVLSGNTASGPVELAWEQMFELARMVGFRVVCVGDTQAPTAREAQQLVRWRGNFLAHLDANVSFHEVVDCIRVLMDHAV